MKCISRICYLFWNSDMGDNEWQKVKRKKRRSVFDRTFVVGWGMLSIPFSHSNDFPLAVIGCYKDFRSIANARSLCHGEGFLDVNFKYLGGLWLMFEFKSLKVRDKFLKHDGILSWFSTLKLWHDDFVVDERLVWLEVEGVPIRAWDDAVFNSICNKWGEVIFSDDSDSSNRLCKRLCIKSKHSQLLFATIFVTLMKVTYATRVREFCSWTPTFADSDSNCDEGGLMDFQDNEAKDSSDVNDAVSVGGIFAEGNEDYYSNKPGVQDLLQDVEDIHKALSPRVDCNSDPFGLNPLINKKVDKKDAPQTLVTPDFPPGFSPTLGIGNCVSYPEVQSCNQIDYNSSKSILGDSHKPMGFSMLERLEETIKIGTALGLNMEGCENNLTTLIANNGDVKTKLVHVDIWMLRQVWGNMHFDFAFSSITGLSGGIICLWNNLVFNKSNIRCHEIYVVVHGTWIPYDVRIMWIAVYASQSLYDKIALWSSLFRLINNLDGILISLGDFNMVREAGERFGSNFIASHADIFNNFISNSSLADVPLGSYKFTWSDKWGSKMSKLARFLVSESFFDAFPNTIGVILEKGVPDHRPILLKEHLADFGPTPFWFFHSWLDLDGFHSLKFESCKIKKEHLLRLSSIDAKIDQGIASDLNFFSRRDLTKIVGGMDWLEANDLAQKARIKWALEDLDCVKSAFVDHFRSRFHHENSDRPSFDIQMLNLLPHDQRDFLDRDISCEEIKRAVWDCGSDRAPGPDGFTFKFFTTFWDLIESNVVRFVHDFFLNRYFPKRCNSSFIALIPKVSNVTLVSDFRPISLINCQYKIIGKILANRLSLVIGSCISPEQSAFIKGSNILDGPLILNEVINWYRKRKENLMIFKVDFEKAFDSLRWDFLDIVMEKIGFGPRWRSWIKGCFTNARSSILVNGSPTMEFDISKGLRQGDPLSSFLFILAMEGLHALICKAINMGIYRGAIISHDHTRISHLIYADDVIFVGYCPWCGIWSMVKALKTKGLDSLGFCKRKLRDEVSIKFWDDSKCGDQPLKSLFPRVHKFDLDSNCFLLIGSLVLNAHPDSWSWSPDVHNGFSVASAHRLVDSHFLGAAPLATRWNKYIPIKANVFLWRAMLNKLPTRVNLDHRGIDVDSLLCPIFHEDVETVNHLFFSCEVAKDLWGLLAKCWELDVPFCVNISEWLLWLDSAPIPAKARPLLDGVGGVLMWSIWCF
nr:putative RNA-directed DNA polymerase, eukaryota, reverse transcriptase zinc-binding domain protein [Tanacetum cinerariifolium]